MITKKKPSNLKKGIMPYLLLTLFIIFIMYILNIYGKTVNELTYDEYINNLRDGSVTEITLEPNTAAGVYEVKGKLEDYKLGETFFVTIPLSEEIMGQMLTYKETHDFKMKVNPDSESSSWYIFLLNYLPIMLLILIAYWFFSKQINGANKSMDFGRSKAKLSADDNKVTFQNVAGLQEEKEEVKELIDFLKDPKKFKRLGARIPKGVLLFGAPGTGKTLLAKAVAGEAKVPFYFISGSEFVELFVGVGASRVRDMFKQAKMTAPCLIFIDEIDAVGRQRGSGIGGGHDEREQTLNQLLTEMDGFGANEGIIVIAATNRPDVLDPALLRPGRFDRQITVNLPDVKGREEILEVHAKNKKFNSKVLLSNVAKRTPGFSGADLENLLNEAALLAVRRNKMSISMSEIDEATDRVLMGPAKVSKKYTEKEKRLTAYHEAGHVVLGLKLDDANDVQKVTIIPRGKAGGYAMMLPKEETYTSTKSELIERIIGLLGGRVAEELIFDEVTTGSHNDFEKATKIARAMVTEYGMSDLGPMQLEHQTEDVFLGRDYNKTRNFSDIVAHEIDEEMRKIINGCYKKAKEIIEKNKDLLILVAETLVKVETLTKEQIEELANDGKLKEEESLEDKTLIELKEMAKERKIDGYTKMKKAELIKNINEN